MSLRNVISTAIRARTLRLLPAHSRPEVILVFHFNQDFVPWLDFVSHSFYQQLVQLLRGHPQLPVHIHISGSCLTGLQWFNPALVELIRRGVEAGQFTLLESTWSQCLPQAVSPEMFALQLDEHRRLLNDVFEPGDRPAFWNPERAWSPQLAELLVAHGIKRTFIEDRVLKDGGAAGGINRSLTATVPGGSLELLPDSNSFRSHLNLYLATGRFSPLESYLRSAAHSSQPSMLVYAEDAEAVGLWEFEAGRDHRVEVMFQRLDWFLRWLEDSSFLQVRKISELSPPGYGCPAGQLPRRTALWLEHALQDEQARHHEGGYRDGFDYLERAPHIQHFQELQTEVMHEMNDSLQRLAGPAGNLPVPACIGNLSRRLLVHHSYEFGCPGLHNLSSTGLQRIQLARVPANLLLEALRRDEPLRRRDLDRDGGEELLLVHPGMLAVLTADGGLRFLFRVDGSELTGGHLPGYLLESGSDLRFENLDLKSGNPLWTWLEDAPLGAYAMQTYRLRRLKFVEIPGTDTRDWPQLQLVNRSSPVYLALFIGESESLGVRKEYDCARDTLYVRYRISNRLNQVQTVSVGIETTFAPDYDEVIAAGRHGLHYYGITGLPFGGGGRFSPRESGIGVRNAVTGNSVRVTFPRRPPDEVETYDVLHALGMAFHYRFTLQPGEDVQFALQILAELIEG